MNNKKEIISYVGEREIEFCVHFTNVTNLPSIVILNLILKSRLIVKPRRQVYMSD